MDLGANVGERHEGVRIGQGASSAYLQRPCLFAPNGRVERYWLTPPELYRTLDDEFHFDCDPCPYPLPEGHNALTAEWGASNFVNPPFRKKDGRGGGPTAFARKAIEESEKGHGSVLLLPVYHYVHLLMAAGAEFRAVGRVRWLEATTKQPMRNPLSIGCFVLKGKGA